MVVQTFFSCCIFFCFDCCSSRSCFFFFLSLVVHLVSLLHPSEMRSRRRQVGEKQTNKKKRSANREEVRLGAGVRETAPKEDKMKATMDPPVSLSLSFRHRGCGSAYRRKGGGYATASPLLPFLFFFVFLYVSLPIESIIFAVSFLA